MRIYIRFTSSVIAAPVSDVWAAVTSPEGINDELRPWLRMTVPRRFRHATIADISPGTVLGRSFFLLFGLVPIDYDDITIAEIDPGTRFLERSTMLSMSAWTHERTLRAIGEATCVTDVVTFVARAPLAWIPGWSRLLRRVLQLLFRHRHRRLAERFSVPRRTAPPELCRRRLA
jgi:ligand-binding SRPBCC domain-containing protein